MTTTPLPPGHTRTPAPPLSPEEEAFVSRPPAAESWGQRVETAAKAGWAAILDDTPWEHLTGRAQDRHRTFAAAALHADARPTGGETESEPLCGDCDYPCGPDGCSCPDECPAVKSEGRSR